MKKLVISIITLFFIIFSVGCDDSNPVTVEEEIILYLVFSQEKSGEDNIILVTFLTNDWESNPTIVVNGFSMERESFRYQSSVGDERYLQAQKVVPYTKSCNYSITVEGKTTYGSIDMPSLPYNVFCNEIELGIDSNNTINFSDTLNFSWSCDSSNGVQNYLYNDNFFNSSYASSKMSYLIEDSTDYIFSLKSAYVSHFDADAMPDVLEYYDYAFISSESYLKHYKIRF